VHRQSELTTWSSSCSSTWLDLAYPLVGPIRWPVRMSRVHDDAARAERVSEEVVQRHSVDHDFT